MATLHHGVVVDPTDPDAVAAALLGILTHPQTWDDMSTSGVKNIMVGAGGTSSQPVTALAACVKSHGLQASLPLMPRLRSFSSEVSRSRSPTLPPRPTPGPPTARSTWTALRRRSGPSRSHG